MKALMRPAKGRSVTPSDRSSRSHVRRIDHVGVVVRDIATASRRWAVDLGFEIAQVADVLDGTVRLAYLDAGDTTLQLVQPLVEGPLAAWLEQHGEGLHHICLEVDELNGTLDAIRDEGKRFIYRGGRGADVCFIGAQPCGVLVELTEPSTNRRPGDSGDRRADAGAAPGSGSLQP